MKIFLDDTRPCPEGWVLAKTAKEATRLLASNPIEIISLDHDLGDEAENGNGNDVLLWIEKVVHRNANYIPPQIFVHSANPPAVAKMVQGIEAIKREIANRVAVHKTILDVCNYQRFIFIKDTALPIVPVYIKTPDPMGLFGNFSFIDSLTFKSTTISVDDDICNEQVAVLNLPCIH